MQKKCVYNKKLKKIKSCFFKWKLSSILFSFIFFSGTHTFAQTYYFENYTVEEGLPSSKVYTIIQDSSDYLWLGTYAGVSKYDGFKFVNFSTEDGLAPGGVRTIVIDQFGMYWFGHLNGGLTRYDGKTFQQIKYENNNSDVFELMLDVDNNIWAATIGAGVFLIHNSKDVENLKIENFKGGKLGDQVYGGTVTSDSSIYLLTVFGIKKYLRDSSAFVNYSPEGLTSYFFNPSILEDTKGNMWIGTRNGGLIKFDKALDKFLYYDIKDGLETNFIWDIFEDSKSNIWISNIDDNNVKGGITQIKNGQFHVFNKHNGLTSNLINSVTEDKEGNILLSSLDKGFYIYKGEQFVNFFEEDLTNDVPGLIDKNVYAIYQDRNDNIWFGTDKGITVYNPKNEKSKFTHYSNESNKISAKIRHFAEDVKGNIWIGTYAGGLYMFDINKKTFVKNTRLDNLALYSDKVVTALVIDDNNNLWAGSHEGLGYYEIDNQVGDRITQGRGISGNNIRSLYLDDEGNIWIGALNAGITLLKKEADSFHQLKSLASSTPTAFIRDKSGILWVGTDGQGLFAIEGDSVIRKYNTRAGLLSNLITSLAIDNKNNLYVGTNKGLNKLVIAENMFYTYTKRNGFVGIEAKEHAVFSDNEGFIWFGTANGATRYNPQLQSKKTIEPLTHITGMKVNLEDYPMSKSAKLKHNQNHIIFDFTSICLTNPDAVKYQFMLEGIDNDWQPVTTHQQVTYQALNPGKYLFKLRAKNSYGIWNSKPVTYWFAIRPPFYFTWWFILIFVSTLTFLVFIYIKRRERNLIKEKKILEEKVQERTREVTLANAQLETANEELQMKNKDITDSIKYAQRIQFAILPPEIPFSNTFVFFKPKDIVSGDFYWMSSLDNKEFFAAVDCTGHGVPGAFMSFIGYSSLNKIIKEHKITQPAEILNRLNIEVTGALHEKGEDKVNDGMDLALVAFDTNNNKLEYSGAYNPLYLVRNDEIISVKANRRSIGRSLGVDNEFSNHELQIEKGDAVYVFSDGFADQFGGPEGKKFKTAGLKKLLLSIQDKDINEQKLIIEQTFDKWTKGYEQIDDILIIGRKF